MNVDDLDNYESKLELDLYQEYRSVIEIYKYAVETERRFYLCNDVTIVVRTEGTDVFYDVTMTDGWVWDMYRQSRFITKAKVMTFKDVSIEELQHSELRVPGSQV